jgi:hypothetical protein
MTTKRRALTTALDLLAIGAVTAGCLLIFVPAGLIVGGLLAGVLSWRLSA